MTLAPCPTHGSTYRALHEHNFRGIVEVIDDLFLTISGVVGTTSYSRCAVGYPWNFEGVVRALEDLNTTISGIQGGGSNVVAGSGIYTTTSGDYTLINNAIVGGSGVYITYSGSYAQINTSVTQASGIIYTAGSGLYLSDGNTRLNLGAYGEGNTTVTYNGSRVAISGSIPAATPPVSVSGTPIPGFSTGSLWFDTNEGRLFVYASGNGVTSPAWYQTNTDAIALKGELPPSGTGLNAPPRDGSLWFNTLMGNLFVYDASSSGWYETGPSRSFAYGTSQPASTSIPGAGWLDATVNRLKVWNGSTWSDIDIDGGVY